MADEPLTDRLAVNDLLESVEGESGNHGTGNGESQQMGARVGGAIGAILGRKLGVIVGERIIDDLLLGEERSPDADEEVEDDEPSEEAEDDESSGEDDTETSDGQGADVDSVEDLDELSYRDLQKLAKEVDVKANLKREEMTERITEALELDA